MLPPTLAPGTSPNIAAINDANMAAAYPMPEPQDYVPPRPDMASPGFQALQQAMQRQAVNVSPDQLEQLKWNNWAASQNFESRDPYYQRQLVQQYYNNVLPYVASATGADPARYQQEFVVKYPNVSMLVPEAAEQITRREIGQTMGLEGPMLDTYGLTGEIPQSKQTEIEQRMQSLTSLGKNPNDPEWEAWVLSGNDDLIPLPNTQDNSEYAKRWRFAIDTVGLDPNDPAERQQIIQYAMYNKPVEGQTEYDTRRLMAAELGYVPGTIEYNRWVGEGKVAGVEDSEMAARQATLEELKSRPGGDALTPQQEMQYLATGRMDLVNDQIKAEQLASKQAELDAKADDAKIRAFNALDIAEKEADLAIRAGSRALEGLGYRSLGPDGQPLELNADSTPSGIGSSITGNYVDEGGPGFLGSLVNPRAGSYARNIEGVRSWFGTSPYSAIDAELETLRADSMFSGLARLREASVDGSSGLGQLTVTEQNALKNRVANIDLGTQSREQVAQNIREVVALLIEDRRKIREKREQMRAEYPELARQAQAGGVTTAPTAAGTGAGAAVSDETINQILEQMAGQSAAGGQ